MCGTLKISAKYMCPFRMDWQGPPSPMSESEIKDEKIHFKTTDSDYERYICAKYNHVNSYLPHTCNC